MPRRRACFSVAFSLRIALSSFQSEVSSASRRCHAATFANCENSDGNAALSSPRSAQSPKSAQSPRLAQSPGSPQSAASTQEPDDGAAVGELERLWRWVEAHGGTTSTHVLKQGKPRAAAELEAAEARRAIRAAAVRRVVECYHDPPVELLAAALNSLTLEQQREVAHWALLVHLSHLLQLGLARILQLG